MATFNFDEYQKQQAARKAASQNANQGERKPVHFMNEFLSKDGDQVVVRFPYSTLSDLSFETGHKVVGVFPGDKFGKFVRCTGDDTCPLCNSQNADQKKKITRFFAKMVVYNPVASGVELCATVWDRPAMFADSDLKSLMTEYPDLTKYLFKITRTGNGKDTKYAILPVNMQSPVYSNDVYKKDFSCLEGIDATRILSKTVEQYQQALNPNAEKVETAPVQEVQSTPAKTESVADVMAQYNTPNSPFTSEGVEMIKGEPEVKVVPQVQPIETTSGGTKRYKF